MNTRPLAVALVLALTGCAGMQSAPSPRQQLLITCQSYVETLQALTVHRQLGTMSNTSVERVDQARAILNPICSGPSPMTTDGVTLSLRDALIRAETALAAMIAAKEKADDA